MFGKTRFSAWARRAVLILALSSLSAGCGSKGTVSGKVFYKGNPLPGGTVTFQHEAGEAFNAVIGGDGSYRVNRIPAGQATITVSSPDPPQPTGQKMEKMAEKAQARKIEIPPEMAKHMGDPEAGTRRYMSIPSKYKDPKESGLKYTVKSGSQNYDIQLE